MKSLLLKSATLTLWPHTGSSVTLRISLDLAGEVRFSVGGSGIMKARVLMKVWCKRPDSYCRGRILTNLGRFFFIFLFFLFFSLRFTTLFFFSFCLQTFKSWRSNLIRIPDGHNLSPSKNMEFLNEQIREFYIQAKGDFSPPFTSPQCHGYKMIREKKQRSLNMVRGATSQSKFGED